ncbi:HEAT repeat domain-containing protein [Candidatus Thiodiazotropha sp. LNASS1]|uniref:HEAT repeat domain-containing protein n=1 Tax=Candidatus Thiodiazotropha sp. LNASS1 TaxID=3096260 RepID=UPI0034DE2B83
MSERDAPDALLLMAPGCAHCPVVLQNLSQLLKQGRIGRLEAVNIIQHPVIAQSFGTRTVPWTRIGCFELEGVLSLGELERWIDMTDRDEGKASYLIHLFETQRAHAAVTWLQRNPDAMPELLGLLRSPTTPIVARIGIGVVAEDLQGTPLWQSTLTDLLKLTQSPDAALRADAAHYLGLTRSSDAIEPLRGMLDDDNPDVREIANESLELLNGGNS